MYFTLTLIKDTKIFKHVADESTLIMRMGQDFTSGLIGFGMENDTYNVCVLLCFFPMFSTFPVLVLEF